MLELLAFPLFWSPYACCRCCNQRELFLTNKVIHLFFWFWESTGTALFRQSMNAPLILFGNINNNTFIDSWGKGKQGGWNKCTVINILKESLRFDQLDGGSHHRKGDWAYPLSTCCTESIFPCRKRISKERGSYSAVSRRACFIRKCDSPLSVQTVRFALSLATARLRVHLCPDWMRTSMWWDSLECKAVEPGFGWVLGWEENRCGIFVRCNA